MHQLITRLHENISRVFFGDPAAVDRVIRCLLARGHILVEDVPGVGKTVLATAVARSIDAAFSRIQLTPDLLPGDILGVTIYDRNTGEFVFKRGPIFANIILADEINRTPPRTQAALLEAMSEAQVSVDGRVLPLPQPFMVVATQNPFDFEGTYMLPENQLDRFLMRISLGYPSPEQEARVLDVRPAATPLHSLGPILDAAQLVALQDKVDSVRTEKSILDYVVALASATRRSEALRLGLSPRGSLALAQAARATAFTKGRDYVVPDDVVENIDAVCAHRVLPRGQGAQPTSHILREILRSVPSPA